MKLLRIAALALFALPAAAHEVPLTYDRVNLHAQAEAEVDNDVLVAVVYAQREGATLEPLVADVNRAVGWAVEQARAAEGVKLQTQDYRSHPVHDRQRLTGWRVRQALRLESRDAAVLSALLGVLQDRVAVEGVGYEVSPERMRDAEQGLIRAALDAFTARARLVAAQLGAEGYRLVQLNLSTGGARPPVPLRAMAMEARAAAPVLEAGTRTVQVSADGTIELERR